MTEQEPRRKWPRQAAAVCGLALLLVLAAGVAWNLTSLRGLPDIGDPFDVAAFTSIRVRDEDNAFVLYRQAESLYPRWEGGATYEWPKAAEAERRWLEVNRDALLIWKRGTERPDASFLQPGELVLGANVDILARLRDLARLACLEGSRVEAEGDTAGAWGWYRAVLRASRHYGRRGGVVGRIFGIAIHRHASVRITAWARRSDIDAKALRETLGDVQAIDTMTAPMSDSVKSEYLTFFQTMGRPDLVWEFLMAAAQPSGSSSDRPPIIQASLLRVGAFLKREPERSRRVFKLVAANWLAFCDLTLDNRPLLDPTHKLVYLAESSVPPNAHPLSPDRMNAWYESTVFLHQLYPTLDASRNAIDRERAIQAALVVHLASELYQREHGEPPDSLELLVGPYLEALPSTAVPK